MAALPATFVEGYHDKQAVEKMEYRKMDGPGWEVSKLSLGTSSLGSVFRKTNEEESIEVVRTAIKQGINLIDTSPWYGHGKSEIVLGKALQGQPRQAYYLMTKVGRYQPQVDQMFDFRAERVLASIDESLARLGVEYIDVGQVHDPEFAPNLDIICNETLPALAKAKAAGKIRHIGITGYPLSAHRYMLENSSVPVDTALTYCHYSLNDTTLEDHLQMYKQHNVGVINASAISMGLLSNRGPPSWHPAGQHIKLACKQAAEYCKSKDTDLGKLAMHFTLSNKKIPSTLVSTASLDRLKVRIMEYNTLSDALAAVMNTRWLAQSSRRCLMVFGRRRTSPLVLRA
eukprot:TRINITY_DN12411_c0_g1_i13.p1 TRINITY_DN12411_c0_g1~~TRINITY_DN12411_c0_g1_i13.p1  ORF type:complete len:343 (+),score=62.00 TRINITY_DN12411_c0_g1_i13:103-1131(+)